MKEKISGVYRIDNIVTGDFYIGSSKNVKKRWGEHKRSSVWNRYPNNPLYLDMQKYGLDKFEFTILCEVEPEQLTTMEQKMIQELCPTYNKNNAYVIGVRCCREDNIDYMRIRRQSEEGKEYNRKQARKDMKKYRNQLCSYKGEVITLGTLSARFRKVGIKNPTSEAKKYLIKN